MHALPQAARSHRLQLLSLFSLSLLTLLAGCQPVEEPMAAEVRPVRFVTIETRTNNDVVNLTGRVQAQTEINQSFRIDGRLIERAVEIGDNVKKGQLIARVDPENEESGVQAAQAQLIATQARLIEARSSQQRMRELIAENAVSKAAFEQAEAMFSVAQSQVKSTESQLALAKNRLSYTRLFSSVNGVVTARAAEPGEVVAAGRMIVQIAEENALDAVFDVPASVKNSASRDSEITITLSSDPRITAFGRVREVAPRADPITGTFNVRVQLLKPPVEMRLGSIVSGHMRTADFTGIELPASALARASDGQNAVWVIDPQTHTVALRTIEVSAFSSDSIQISQGVSSGEMVVTAGAQTLRTGQKVKLLGAAL